jgi:osmotically-inducible protein OsmY
VEKLSHVFQVDEATPAPTLVDLRSLSARIKRTIRRQTGGGVSELRVEVDGETVRLHGNCPTFYCKQLAQQAAMRIAQSSFVENLIVVQQSS